MFKSITYKILPIRGLDFYNQAVREINNEDRSLVLNIVARFSRGNVKLSCGDITGQNTAFLTNEKMKSEVGKLAKVNFKIRKPFFHN